MNLVSIVIINWNSKSYLKTCIDSILNQTYKNLEIVFIDNGSYDGSCDLVKEIYEDRITIIDAKENLGYSKAANLGIDSTLGKYIVIMNPDVVFDKDFIENLYKYAESDEKIGGINGKYLKYDFKNDCKVNIIDSTGLIMYKTRRCLDIGQDEHDNGQYNEIKRVFGVCGAAAFYRREALEKVKVDKEYFDEDFFAYKEDVDLSWRLNLYGYKCMYLPNAVAYHGRGFGGSKNGLKDYLDNRKNQSNFLKKLSYRNHHLMLIKNETSSTYKKSFFYIWYWILLYLIYSIIFERQNLRSIKQILNLKEKMKMKNTIICSSSCKLGEEYINFMNNR